MQNGLLYHKLSFYKKKGKIFSLLSSFFIFIGFVLLDQATKLWSQKSFMLSFSPTEIKDYIQSSHNVFSFHFYENSIYFDVTYVRNTGAAWGILGNLPENIRPAFFYILTFLAMIFILFLFFKTPQKHTLSRLGIVFVLSGAAGNFIDRFYLHYVIDWISFHWNILGWQYHYPVFNVADSVVTLGGLFILIDNIFEEIKIRKLKKQNSNLKEKI
jgi:signal peptidase II